MQEPTGLRSNAPVDGVNHPNSSVSESSSQTRLAAPSTAIPEACAPNPQVLDGGGSGKRYRFSDTGLDADSLRAKAKAYQERYDVASEVLT